MPPKRSQTAVGQTKLKRPREEDDLFEVSDMDVPTGKKSHVSRRLRISSTGELLQRSNTRNVDEDRTLYHGPLHLHLHLQRCPLRMNSPPSDDDKIDTTGPLQAWADDFRQIFLEEFVRLAGRCGHYSCDGIHTEEEEGLYRCKDCLESHLFCADCIVTRHERLPLHRIEVWEDGYFHRATLASLGLVIQLGHDGGKCLLPSPIRRDFLVIDISGHHEVNLQFCGCSILEEHIQLLRTCWYPATTSRPRTAFTFDYMSTFHFLTLQGKLSAYDFCLSIERKTDDTGTLDIQSRYEQFLLCMRQYRHLLSLMRNAKSLGPEGVEALEPGDLAVDCPACPHSDANLPEDWEASPPDVKWKYTLNLTIDANFRLKNRDRKTQNDTALGDGLGHWVPHAPYMAHIAAHAADTEPNLCDSTLKAVDHAQSKVSKGYSSTGVAGTLCARHGLVRKNGLGNLQKGERYANTDFVVLYSLKNEVIPRLCLSYDIACQWSRNFPTRNQSFPIDMRLSDTTIREATFVVPKFHLYAHGSKCQAAFSLSYIPWSAETDGEDPERWWSHVNPVSMSTKIMGAGSRVDTIDDHAASWNWRKIVNMGSSLHERLALAIRMKARHTALHTQFSAEFEPSDLRQWLSSLQAWENNRTKPNPFATKETSGSLSKVRSELAEEDAPMIANEVDLHGSNEFLYKGLELEETQRVLSLHPNEGTTNAATDLQLKRNTLNRQIALWRTEQGEYMPLIDVGRHPASSIPETIPLYLPSSLPATPSLLSLRDKERRLRLAQVQDSLQEIRRLLRVTAGLSDFKHTKVGFSQIDNTRVLGQIHRFKAKSDIVIARYRAARAALIKLDPQGSWIAQYQVLRDEDIRWPRRDPTDVEAAQENRRAVSWIWRSSAQHDGNFTEASGAEIGNALKLEWLKSYARQRRWSEELDLVLEEMRRVAAYLKWKANETYRVIRKNR
ncbi:hypothetical protein ONZ45_g18198 [Pleurotus djamor]|nr:hypothetical protein ONZ45_g18198 [Pleurotus djamor]